MKSIHVGIRRIGNSHGVVIPKPVLAQLGLNGEAGAEMPIEGDTLVLRRPASPVRGGWAEAARKSREARAMEGVLASEVGRRERPIHVQVEVEVAVEVQVQLHIRIHIEVQGRATHLGSLA